MFWPFIELDGELTYCPLAEFGTQNLREGKDLYGKAVIAQPLAAHLPLHNAAQASGKIVVVERGQCDFVTKVLHAQAAGAIAVLIANTSREQPDEAFVMDAGRRSKKEISSIRIPAMMVSYNKATALFDQLRECFLDRRELSVTIRFLGAQTSAYVLEKIENVAKQRENQAREIAVQHQRQQQQKEAAELLRKRLGKDPTVEAQVVSPPLSRSGSSTFSITSSSQQATLRSETPSADSQSTPKLPAFLGDSMETLSVASYATDRFERQSSKSVSPFDTAMHHWCPMTTALLIVDMQNYFALEQNDICVPHLHESSRVDFYKRVKSVVVPNLQDILLACRACEGIEILYTVVESSTRDGRDRSRAHKHVGLHVARGGFGAQVLSRVAPSDDDIVLPRTGVKYVLQQQAVQGPHLSLISPFFNCLVYSSRPTWTMCCGTSGSRTSSWLGSPSCAPFHFACKRRSTAGTRSP
jgi:hypothetical protein